VAEFEKMAPPKFPVTLCTEYGAPNGDHWFVVQLFVLSSNVLVPPVVTEPDA
jgi:hypothetical protein